MVRLLSSSQPGPSNKVISKVGLYTQVLFFSAWKRWFCPLFVPRSFDSVNASLINHDAPCTHSSFRRFSLARRILATLNVSPMVSYRRVFTVNPDALAPEHPYSVDNSKNSFQIAFFEFRGIGPPSTDFGYPGDVYVDLTPGAHALYWRDRHGRNPGQWRRWRSVVLDKVPLYKYLVSHPWANNPQRSDLFLWVDPDGVTWTSRAAICASRVAMVQKNIATIPPGEKNPNVDALIAEILVKMLQLEESRALPPIKDAGGNYSNSSPKLSHRPSSYTEHRGRSNSSASQYSPPETSRRIPPINSPSDRPRLLPTRLAPVASSPPPTPILYTSSHHSHRPLSATPPPIPSTSDSRHHVISSPPQRQVLTQYPPYGAAGPSNPRMPETLSGPSTSNPNPGATEQEMRESFAWNEMQRAQYAEAHFKRELRIKNRELSKFKKKEKDVISMSFMYQKKEQELIATLASVEKRSHAELEAQRAALRAAQRQVEEAEQQTREAVRELRRLEEALADARREIKELKSREQSRTLSSPHQSRPSSADADRMEVENGELKEELSRISYARGEPEGRSRDRT